MPDSGHQPLIDLLPAMAGTGKDFKYIRLIDEQCFNKPFLRQPGHGGDRLCRPRDDGECIPVTVNRLGA